MDLMVLILSGAVILIFGVIAFIWLKGNLTQELFKQQQLFQQLPCKYDLPFHEKCHNLPR